MTTTRRKASASVSLGLLVLAMIFGSLSFVSPAQAAEAPTTPLNATLEAASTSVVTGKIASFTGTSPVLPVPVIGEMLVPDVAIQVKNAAGEYTDVATVTPEGDGSFVYSAKQVRTTTYRAVPLAPVGSPVAGLLDTLGVQLIASGDVTVTSKGTVTLKAKRVAKRTYVVSGKAAPAQAGQAVSVQVKKGKTFRTVRTVRTTAAGAYKARVKMAKGKRVVRVVAAGTDAASKASKTRAIRVR